MTPHIDRPLPLAPGRRWTLPSVAVRPMPPRPGLPWVGYPRDLGLIPAPLEYALVLLAVTVVSIVCWPELVVPVLRLMGEVGVVLREVGEASRP